MKIAMAISVMLLSILLSSCDNSSPDKPVKETGKLILKFDHHVEGQPLQLNEMKYLNAAGNPYEVNELMYFISDVTLHRSDGTQKQIRDWKEIHYVELGIPSTLTWEIYDDIEAGAYDSISFIFGIPEEKNESFMFVDPPENKMMWPDILGGGYHYLMINGKWRDETDTEQFYNFHLGIGQLYKGDVIHYDSIYAFVQNYFSVTLPGSHFTLSAGATKEIAIIMNIESWFDTPHVFNFNYWGGAIMEIQPAMQTAAENGHDVFSVGSVR